MPVDVISAEQLSEGGRSVSTSVQCSWRMKASGCTCLLQLARASLLNTPARTLAVFRTVEHPCT